ncbi:oligopeptide/dipeptide ABC transporter ATP-binding protein [Chlamydia pecorum]|uniref:oligopeptide/dipeptide ABC transporter ATP-binding protein n=1 Tax=Chlamydia pecorum TaxID=85991 RepID=UPI0003ADADB1|nr:oligopeptide/dipeptide ABC transporter ATP-binding protein [Chlamydia pecorum]AGW39416.1 putative peptide ABC transport ATP-binding protein [Chlamydia pecorum P787]
MTKLPLIQAQNLSTYYYKRSCWLRRKTLATKAIDNLSFSLYPNRITGLIGESGSGKSTLALGLAGLLPFTSGYLSFSGTPIKISSKQGRQQLCSQTRMVFQNPQASLNPRKTIFDSLGHSLLYHKLISKDKLHAKVAESLELVGLSSSYMYYYPQQLSGGQQQRVSIARALLGAPKLIICDEIVSALDLSMQAQILNMLLDLQARLHFTYLFISHDLAIVRSLCSDILIMYKGQIVESGPTEEIFASPQHPYTEMLLRSQLPDSPSQRIPNQLAQYQASPQDRAEETGCIFYSRCPYKAAQCKTGPIANTTVNRHSYRCIKHSSTPTDT